MLGFRKIFIVFPMCVWWHDSWVIFVLLVFGSHIKWNGKCIAQNVLCSRLLAYYANVIKAKDLIVCLFTLNKLPAELMDRLEKYFYYQKACFSGVLLAWYFHRTKPYSKKTKFLASNAVEGKLVFNKARIWFINPIIYILLTIDKVTSLILINMPHVSYLISYMDTISDSSAVVVWCNHRNRLVLL